MNKKGMEISQAGTLVVLAVALIVGLVLLQAAAQNIGTAVNTVALANESLGATVVNGTAQYLTNWKSISNPVVINETGGVVIGAGNYTITNNVVYNGQEAVRIVPDTAAAWKTKWKISGTVQPLTYDSSAGGRTVTSLILIFGAIALVAVSLWYVLKDNNVIDF